MMKKNTKLTRFMQVRQPWADFLRDFTSRAKMCFVLRTVRAWRMASAPPPVLKLKWGKVGFSAVRQRSVWAFRVVRVIRVIRVSRVVWVVRNIRNIRIIRAFRAFRNIRNIRNIRIIQASQAFQAFRDGPKEPPRRYCLRRRPPAAASGLGIWRPGALWRRGQCGGFRGGSRGGAG